MYTALVIHGLALLTVTWWVTRRCGSVINPVTYFAGFYAVQSLLSPFLYGTLGLFDDTDPDVIAVTAFYSSLYFACIALPFLLAKPRLYIRMHRIGRRLLPRKVRITRGTYVAIGLQLLAVFMLLIVASGTTLWLTEPRVAYQDSRAGAGVWWSQCQAMLVLGMAAYITRRQRKLWQIAVACFIAGYGASFLGSKAFMLFPVILAAFYYEHAVRPIPRIAVLVGALTMATGVFALQLIQGTAVSVAETIAYFDYFPNTTKFMADFGERFEHTYGGTWLSSLWQYVPRGLVSSKPFVYGQVVIMETYSPGAAELGATPGILPWAAAYLDFGALGVIAEGYVVGLISWYSFILLRVRRDLVALLVLGQIGLITSAFAAPFYGAPFLLFLAWLTVQIFWLRIVAGPKRRRIRQAAVATPAQL